MKSSSMVFLYLHFLVGAEDIQRGFGKAVQMQTT